MFKKKEVPGQARPSLDDDLAAMLTQQTKIPQGEIASSPNEGSWNENNKQPNSLNYRKLPKAGVVDQLRRVLIVGSLASLLLLVLGGYFALRYSKDARTGLMTGTRKLAALVKDSPINPYIRPTLQKIHKKVRDYDRELHLNQVVLGESLALSGMTCEEAVKEGLHKKLKGRLSAADRYLLMSCTLFQDSPEASVRYGVDSDIPSLRWDGIAETLILAEAKRRIHILESRPAQKNPHCPAWKPTAACMIRFAVEAFFPHPIPRWEDAYALLNRELAQQASHAQAWLHFLAGEHALKMGKAAEPYYKKAREALTRINDPFLEREIFRGRVRNAFQTKNVALMEAVWEERPFKRFTEDSAAFLDVELMQSLLIMPSDASKSQLEIFLLQATSFQRFRFHPTWLRIIVEQSILFDLAEPAQEWFANVLKQGKMKDGMRMAEVYGLLHIRLLLAAERYLEVLEEMMKMERFAAKTTEWHQLKGLAMLGASNSKERSIQAAKEFQAATNIQPQSASPFALIVTFLSLDLTLKAEVTLSYWGQMKREDDFLYIIARGLVRYGSGDREAAHQIWKDGQAKYPKQSFWASLKQNLDNNPEYLRQDLFHRLRGILPPDSALGPLALWRQKP